MARIKNKDLYLNEGDKIYLGTDKEASLGYIIKNGINRNRMSFKGFGTSKPIHPIPEKSAQEEEDNRRVEIMILSK